MEEAIGNELRLAHIGINAKNEEDAVKTAELLCSILGYTGRNCSSSIFVGDAVEVMRKPFRGENGHICQSKICQ